MKALALSVEEVERVVFESKEAMSEVDRVSEILNLPLSNSEDVAREVEEELALLKRNSELSAPLPLQPQPLQPHPAFTPTLQPELLSGPVPLPVPIPTPPERQLATA